MTRAKTYTPIAGKICLIRDVQRPSAAGFEQPVSTDRDPMPNVRGASGFRVCGMRDPCDAYPMRKRSRYQSALTPSFQLIFLPWS
jgi:hypothetical protein